MDNAEIVNELVEYFGSVQACAHALGLEISRLTALASPAITVTDSERALLLILLRAKRAHLLEFLVSDRVLVGLEEAELHAPAGLVTLNNAFLYELIDFQNHVIETQRLIVEYYQGAGGTERTPSGTDGTP